MIKVLAIDDEPLALRQLELYISKIPYFERVASCYSAAEAVHYIGKVDAIFIDINMPDMSGMEFVHTLENPPMIVFTTAYSQYAVEGFKVNALDYLMKPFSLEEFKKAAEKIRIRKEEKEAAKEMSKVGTHIYFKSDYKNIKVDYDKIIFVESMSEYIKVHIEGEKVPLIVLYSIKRLAEQLPEDKFCRIHRSYLVSLSRIADITANSVTLDNGKSLPVSDSYKQALKDATSN